MSKRKKNEPERKPIVLPAEGGRRYAMGRISAVFKADEGETAHAYSISEWWLEPHCTGPGAHSHPEDDVFFVIEGTMSILVGRSGRTPRAAPSCSSPAASRTTSRIGATPARGS